MEPTAVRKRLPFAATAHVRDTCLCLHVQRAARVLARHFDEAFRPLDLTHGQFSLLNSLNRPAAARPAEVADLLGMDRTTLTANVKPLERRGLLEVRIPERDRRERQLVLTARGHALLLQALPFWRATHAKVVRALPRSTSTNLRSQLKALSST